MAKNYGLKLTDKEAKTIVDKWRRANNWATTFWSQAEMAAIRAMKAPGTPQKVGRLTYQLIGHALCCEMPPGGWIQYPYARLEPVESKFGTKLTVTYAKASLTPAKDAKSWPRAHLYGGLQVENMSQAVSAEILRHALWELDGLNQNVVAHIHDEIIIEVRREHAKSTMETLARVMNSPPKWASDLPLSAVPVIMERFGK
jgi:DNA polymerase